MKTENEKKKYMVPTIQVVAMSHCANLLDGSCSDGDYCDELALMGNDSSKMGV